MSAVRRTGAPGRRGWRLAALGVGATVVVTAVPVAAAPTCIADPAGDYHAELAPLGDPSADLLSADVSARRGLLTATLRLAALDAAPPVLGHRYDVYVTNGERTVSLTAHVDNGRGSFSLVEVDGSSDSGASLGTVLGPISGRLDAARSTIHLSVEQERLGFAARQRVVVSARTWRSVGTMNTAPDPGRASTYAQMDDSDRTAPYTLGAGGCSR